MNLKNISLALALSSALATSAVANEQLKIVGSSTVYPFSSLVAEEFGATTKFSTPVVESNGSGGGIKLFCAGADKNTPSIANASRQMKKSEFEVCNSNGVTNISEALIGFDGIAVAQSSNVKSFNLTKTQLALALAKEVPSKDGKSLIANPYKKWSDIDASLPNREIIVYGPPKSSGTRDSFEEMILQSALKKVSAYTDMYKKDEKANKKYKKYSEIRTDGAYVESGENDNLIVQRLTKNEAAVGIFGYSFLIENKDKVVGLSIDNVLPTVDAISSGKYPVARSMYFYIKNDHQKSNSSLKEFTKLFMSEKMIGEEGILTEIGLIPLAKDTRTKARNIVLNSTKLKASDLH
ncbi:substrate-binding domain-containing protein [Aliarcobacter thereius]|uniref:Phosphate-binding protein n=2 Tax=Aliarcobacter thereius TaxID=544718 RepID=A0A1C0B9Y5_9BACT|nr:substrate-binding domain-containing protein [Aliarcobacter thereius]OCL91950.1 Phosphate-binding protein PstS precursor [Aliarcobacter thereius]OCL94952.1 Phosphate-binding protein PstS precursor [Aliarcobacter thereius LMG 24486]OCM00400.1 Phosphate-binding protein PstS precursor [Aliarcobacter thereius]QBF15175.1 phosphate ABC transporter, periplasmic phosphate-binding protein [Aliarcobacter thereius LMG 24486]TLS72603.1 phosphate-binding protein [Aliarcobacter thereius]